MKLALRLVYGLNVVATVVAIYSLAINIDSSPNTQVDVSWGIWFLLVVTSANMFFLKFGVETALTPKPPREPKPSV